MRNVLLSLHCNWTMYILLQVYIREKKDNLIVQFIAVLWSFFRTFTISFLRDGSHTEISRFYKQPSDIHVYMRNMMQIYNIKHEILRKGYTKIPQINMHTDDRPGTFSGLAVYTGAWGIFPCIICTKYIYTCMVVWNFIVKYYSEFVWNKNLSRPCVLLY